MSKLKDIPKVDRPREKLEKYGPKKLSDAELLAILLGSGSEGINVLQLSKKILDSVSKKGKDKMKLEDLLEIKGLGGAKASQVVAMLALGERLNSNQNPEILSAEDIWNSCADFRNSKKEHFASFYLDIQSRLIERQIISIGTLNTSLVHPREVFEPAVKLSAASIILVHNHPSNDEKPSEEDIKVTKRLIEAGKLLGIEIADHVIITSRKTYSLKGERII